MRGFLGPRARWVVHPFLFAAAYVLNLALSNQIDPAGILRPLLVALGIAGVLMLGGRLLLGNRWDGALFATLLIAIVVSPVPVASLLFVIREAAGAGLGTAVTAGLLILLLGAVGMDMLRRRHRGLPFRRPSTETLQVLSVALLVAVVASNLITHPPRFPATTGQPLSSAPGETPDMVVILLDGYPRDDVLQRRIGVSNGAFLEGLRQRGFDVAADSESNYMHTALTLASMFQMQYVDEIPSLQPLIGSTQRQLGALHDAAESGRAFSVLHGAGYEVSMAPPGWEHVAFRDAADKFLDSGELSDLEISLLHQSWLLYVINSVAPNLFTDALRDRIVHSLDALDRFAAEQRGSPAFLFLHVPAPHLPLVLNADGSAVQLPALLYEKIDREGFEMTDREYADAWRSELDYLNGRVLSGIDLLLSSEVGRRSVVVVMADHGYNFEVQEDDAEARIAPLFAARTPGAQGLLRDAPTPVNLFPTLFNRYFGTKFAIQPDRYFISDWRTPLQLAELALPVGTDAP